MSTKRDRALDLVRSLGFDPHNVVEVVLAPTTYTVTTYREDADGHKFYDSAARALTETVEFAWGDE